MQAKQLSMGEQCMLFEREFAAWQGRKHCVSFNSGSSANLGLIRALCNLGILCSGNTVGFAAITWATNVMPLIQNGLVTSPIDINTATLNVSPTTVLEALERTNMQAIFLTNALGMSDDIASIKAICDERGILLLEDNCESLGSEYNGVKLGNFGMASTFSFFVGHHLSTIEGGAVCTDDDALDEALRMVRSHGWDRHLAPSAQQRLRADHNVDDFNAKYTFYDSAYNIRPTEIQGFLGRNQLAYLDEMTKKRAENFVALTPIYDNPQFERMQPQMSTHSSFAFPLLCKTEKIKDEYIQKSTAANIEIRPIISSYMPHQPFYKKYVPAVEHELPGAYAVHKKGFYFGNNPEVTPEDIAMLLETFK